MADNPLLNAVLDDPRDDTVRLAYADWLDEVGRYPGHAKIIREHIEDAKAGTAGTHLPEVMPDWHRCMWTMYRPYFDNGALDGAPNSEAIGVVFVRRGFGAELRVRYDQFLSSAHILELFQNHPITSVRLIGEKPLMSDDGPSPAFLWDFRDKFYSLREQARYELRSHVSYAGAVRSMSRICVQNARARAGRPPLLSSAFEEFDAQR